VRQLNPREVATIAQALRVAAHVYGSDAKRGDMGKRQAEEAVAMADTSSKPSGCGFYSRSRNGSGPARGPPRVS